MIFCFFLCLWWYLRKFHSYQASNADLTDDSLQNREEAFDVNSEKVMDTLNSARNEVNIMHLLTFQSILQHFAVVKRQKHSHMTILLKLLKHHKPDPCYDQLPSTREKLLKISEQDFINEGLFKEYGGSSINLTKLNFF